MRRLIGLFFTICFATMVSACTDSEKTSLPEDLTEDKHGLEYVLVQQQIYHVLVDEYLEINDENHPDVNVSYREYQVYDGVRDSVYWMTKSIRLPKEMATTAEAKAYLQKCCSDWLRLEPMTVISEKVKSQWVREGYDGAAEYWSGSPKGLTVEQVKEKSQ